MAWTLKTAEDGAPVIQDGIPVYVDEAGKEAPIDPNQMHAKILELNAESKNRREKIQELTSKLKPLEGIENIEEFLGNATQAIETVKNLEDSDLVKAGEVEKIKEDAKRGIEMVKQQLTEKLKSREDELQGELTKRDAYIRQLMISSKFAQHDLFSGTNPRTYLDPEVAESYFGRFFGVEEVGGQLRVIARGADGDVITSREPGKFAEPADFNEAMELIFSQHPKKDQYLRAGPGGSGSAGGKSGVPGDKKTPLSRLQQQYNEALEKRDGAAMTRIKNRIAALQKQGA
jgi:hypothetical protein